jgi:NADH dehydrogenase
MTERSSQTALEALQRMNIRVLLDRRMTTYDGETLVLDDGTEILTDTVIWAAGVKGKLLEGLPQEMIVKGRVRVDRYNRVENVVGIWAIGDVALMSGDPTYPNGHPQVAPVAKQQGKHLADNLMRHIRHAPLEPFTYVDKGALAVIGRNKAVADVYGKSLGGFIAWVLWAFVHILYLVGFRNKLITTIDWGWNYVSYERYVRLILRPVKRPPKEVPVRD